MKTRCNNPRQIYYGKRGIRYSTAWESYERFLADMGEKPEGKSLERLNNAKGYSKQNCLWASPTQQSRNRRSVLLTQRTAHQIRLLVEMGYQQKQVAKWYGVSPRTVGFIKAGKQWAHRL